MKKHKNIRIAKKHYWIIAAVIALISLMLGTVLGYSQSKPTTDPGYKLASSKSIDSAKNDIRREFADTATICTREDDKNTIQTRKDVFEKYLKVNRYANRAVIRGCSDTDSLLVKNSLSGKWEMTPVNIALDARANPVWQTECLIDDITKADAKIRQENNSIDTNNLVACRILKERDQIFYLGKSVGYDLSEKDIQSQIAAAESFYSLVTSTEKETIFGKTYEDADGWIHECTKPIEVKDQGVKYGNGMPSLTPVHESDAQKYCRKTGIE